MGETAQQAQRAHAEQRLLEAETSVPKEQPVEAKYEANAFAAVATAAVAAEPSVDVVQSAPPAEPPAEDAKLVEHVNDAAPSGQLAQELKVAARAEGALADATKTPPPAQTQSPSVDPPAGEASLAEPPAGEVKFTQAESIPPADEIHAPPMEA